MESVINCIVNCVSVNEMATSATKATKGVSVSDPSKVFLRKYKVIDYEEAEAALKGDMLYFLAGLKRQTACRAAQRLTQKLGFQVTAEPVIVDGEKGYALVKGEAAEWIKRALKRKTKA